MDSIIIGIFAPERVAAIVSDVELRAAGAFDVDGPSSNPETVSDVCEGAFRPSIASGLSSILDQVLLNMNNY